jgi:hypothetical protein
MASVGKPDPSEGPWRNPSWKITRFGIPKSGSYTEIAEYIKAHGLEAAKKEYADVLLNETKFAPNGLMDNGIYMMWWLITAAGAGGVPFDYTNSRLGVSTDNTGFDASQTSLNPTGLASFFMQAMDAGYPTISGQQCSWEATFDGNTANWEWNSFGVDNDGDTADTNTQIAFYGMPNTNGQYVGLLNRLVVSQGTKPSGQTWTLVLIVQQS